MQTVRLLVENLIFIIVLTVFLDMLLPASDMHRYIRMVMGLMVIVAILQGVSGLFWNGLKEELPLLDQASSVNMDSAITAGKKIAAENREYALKDYQEALTRQVKALASIAGGLEVFNVQVQVQDNSNSADFGQLEQISISVGAGQIKDSRTLKVQAGRLADEVANFYDLKPQQVLVQIEKGDGY